jgi:isopenicillin-N N-acyltransferase-like protein
MNSEGLGLCGNYIQTDVDFKQTGVPIPIVRRAILEQSTLASAIAVVESTPRAFSSNHLLAHRSGDAADLEATPQRVYIIKPHKGKIVHANHFQTKDTDFEDVSLTRFPDSLAREQRVHELVDDRTSVSKHEIISIFKDRQGFPHSVCRFTSDVKNQGTIETVASVVMDLSDGIMWLARGPEIKTYDEIRL